MIICFRGGWAAQDTAAIHLSVFDVRIDTSVQPLWLLK